MNLDFELYDGKKYSDLVQDVIKNHKNKQSKISTLISQLTEMVGEEVGNAVIIVPLIKEYLEIDVKNDDALVKLASILQKGGQSTENGDGGLSDKDLELLFSDIQKSTVPLQDNVIKELPDIQK
jgi:transcriptional regulatory protein LevR|tara:strand:- start:1330 stop:1701 length:372 start_codon:yes stop_codon:yes gene_type:complete